MIKLNDLRSHNALALLEDYNGINPYLKKLKIDFLKNKKIILTDNQSRYIQDNYNKDPLLINRIISITPFLGEQLKIDNNLSFLPEKILIEYILADTEKTFHVYGKLSKSQDKSLMYWLPKTQVIDDPYFEKINIDVDFDKYNEVLALEGKQLFNHQKEGIKFLLTRNGCLLADDMGLAKTAQAIIASLESGSERILILCPSSLKINWEREINRFCDDTVIIEGKIWNQAKFTIINYDILKNFHGIEDPKNKDIILNRELVNANFDLIIIDEAHNLKESKSIRGEIMLDLCVKHKTKKVWLLTGTPVANRPMDFYNLLRLIKAPIADNWKFYAERYCEGKKFFKTLKNGKKKQIWLTNGASNLEELSQKTRNIVLRRLKTDVLDMPDKIVTPIYYDLSDKSVLMYNKLWDEYILKRKEAGKKTKLDRALVELILLRQFIAMEAIPKTIELTENAIEQEQKVVIFCNFTDELLKLQEYFGDRCVIHHGKMNKDQKQLSVDEFQNNPNVKVFIGNIKSAGVGLTLTAGSVVIFNSYDWVTGNNIQAEDRCHRIGQIFNVSVYYQIFNNSISIKIWEILKDKKEIIDVILNEKEYTEAETMCLIMEEIMEDYG